MASKLALDASGFVETMRLLSERDAEIAGTWALNDTVDEVKDHIKRRMDVVFDRPTRFTKNAFVARKARTGHLEASVEERQINGKRHYLRVQEEGGPRGQTAFERLLATNLAFDGIVQSVIPAEGARLDAYGNWATAERNQVLSQLNAQRDRSANETTASRKRNRRRNRYFIPKSGLTRDIYKTDSAGIPEMVAHISAKVPVYQQRLGFFDEAERLYGDRLPEHLGRTLGKMIRKRFG